jgi:hypothetical protein
MCVEKEIAANQKAIDYRINATAMLLEGVLRVIYAWQNELAKTCSADVVRNTIPIPVPVIQGRRISDYLRSLELMMAVWERWQPWIDAPRLIGLGSVCRRNLEDREEGLYAILAGLEGRLPPEAALHCCSASKVGACRTSKCTTGSPGQNRWRLTSEHG